MKSSRSSSLLLILASVLSCMLFRCERNDLFEISNAKFSFSNELKVQYSDAVEGWVDVSYDGVSIGSTPFTPSTPISKSFQMINTTTQYSIQITSFVASGNGFSGYVTVPLTIQIGNSFPFTISFTPVNIGSVSTSVNIEFVLVDPTTLEVVSPTKEVSFMVYATGT
jgi:hypothetical protein